jgi:outer membrane protein assembly factor BamB
MRFLFIIHIIAAGIFFASCSGISIEQKIELKPGDWVMAGGTPEQKNISEYVLEPPLNLMWEYTLEGGVGPSGITVSDAVVFVNALQGELFTFDVSTGGKIGKVNFLGRDASSAPLILGKNVVVSYAGDSKYSLASYNLNEGVINWRRNYGYVQTSPILKNGFVYFGNLTGVMYKADVNTGKKVWKHKTYSAIHSTCAVTDDKVIFANDAGTIYCLNTSDGSEAWKFETGLPIISSPMIVGENVYIGGDDSIYTSLRISDGGVNWENNVHSKIIGGSALFIDKDVIFGTVDGNIYSLSKDSGTVNWKYTTKGTITSAPVISGNLVYVTSYDANVYALDASTGNLQWNYTMINKSKTSPVVWKEYLFVAADDVLYCFTSKKIEKKK